MTVKKSPKKQAKPGRPTKFEPGMVDQVYKYCLLGAINKDLAELLGVGITTIDRWLAKDEQFRGAVKRGREIADQKVTDRLFQRACGYEHDATQIMQYKGDPVTVDYIQRYPPDTTACIFWLVNRQRGKWNHVSRTEITGADGKPLPPAQIVPIINLYAPKPDE